MISMPELGHSAWGLFWSPVFAWTVLASVVLLLLNLVREKDWLFQLDLRVALVCALPAAILASWVLPGLPSAQGIPNGASVIPILLPPSPAAPSVPISGTALAVPVDWVGWVLGLTTVLAAVLMLVGALRLVAGLLTVRRIIGASTLDQRASARTGVFIWVSPEAPSPFSYGLFRHGVVVPAGFPFPDLAILHEMDHITSGDLSRSWLLAVTRAAFFFHPLVHRLTNRALVLMEFACDQRVVRTGAISPARYGEALLATASDWRHPEPVMAMTRRKSVRARIENIALNPAGSLPMRAKSTGGVLLLLITLAAGCLGAPAGESIPQALAARLALPVSSSTEAYRITDQVPEIPGGIAELQSRVRYPSAECPERFAGTILVQFHLDPEGYARDPDVLQGITPGCDNEALRVIRESRFLPGVVSGERVWTSLSLPVRLHVPRPESTRLAIRDLRRALEPKDETWPVDFYSARWEINREHQVMYSGGAPFGDRELLAGVARVQGVDGVIVGKAEDMGFAFSHDSDSVMVGVVYTDHPFQSWVTMEALAGGSGTNLREREPADKADQEAVVFWLPSAVAIEVTSADGTPVQAEYLMNTWLEGDLTVTVKGGGQTLVWLENVGRFRVSFGSN